MASFPCVHHIEVGVVDGLGAVDILTSQYSLKVVATRQTEVTDQWLLVRNNIRFLITSLKDFNTAAIEKDDYLINWVPSLDVSFHQLPCKDSVFNVAFEVKNLNSCVQHLKNHGVTFSKPLHTVSDSYGSIKTCVIKSCVGDVHHTLIERGSYSGFFLPGYVQQTVKDLRNSDCLNSVLDSIDHVAFALEMNTAMSVIKWYEQCFGAKRFLINSQEDEEGGLLLSTDTVGLRLRAMEYWKCNEVGMWVPQEDGVTGKLSFVLAEGLPPVPGSKEENQIESWLRQHGGPGIQHVAITTGNIKATVKRLKLLGARFANPPPDLYYTELGRLTDIIRVGEDVEALKMSGILIDTEAEGIYGNLVQRSQHSHRSEENYLLQIFTKPVFKKDPFFLEIIQRNGATGFGSGNVMALYRSVQAYIVGQKTDKDEKTTNQN